MPIVIAPVGKKLRIIKVVTDDKTKKHLENLGLTINSELTVLSRSGGNTICAVLEGRLALDSSIATKIFVA